MGSKKPKKKVVQEEKLPEFIDRIELKHSFSDSEKAEILDTLSRKHEEKELVTAQAKSSAKRWKDKIDEISLKINELSQKGRDGYEFRATDVRVVLNKKKKTKSIFNNTGELIETRDMTDFDFERLPMDLPPPEVKPGQPLTSVGKALEEAETTESAGTDVPADPEQ